MTAAWPICAITGSSPEASLAPQEHQSHRVEDNVKVFQLIDQGNAPVFQRLVHGGIAGCAGKKYDSVLQVRRSSHERVVEVEPIKLRHKKITDHCRDAGISGESVQRNPPGIGFQNHETTALEDLAQRAADLALVIDQEDRGHAAYRRKAHPSPMQRQDLTG